MRGSKRGLYASRTYDPRGTVSRAIFTQRHARSQSRSLSTQTKDHYEIDVTSIPQFESQYTETESVDNTTDPTQFWTGRFAARLDRTLGGDAVSLDTVTRYQAVSADKKSLDTKKTAFDLLLCCLVSRYQVNLVKNDIVVKEDIRVYKGFWTISADTLIPICKRPAQSTKKRYQGNFSKSLDT